MNEEPCPKPPSDHEIAAYMEKVLADIAAIPETPADEATERKEWAKALTEALPIPNGDESHGPDTAAIWLTCRRWLYKFLSSAFNPELDLQTKPLPKWLWLAGPSGIGKTFLATKTFTFAKKHAPARINGNIYREPGLLYDFRLPTAGVICWKDVMGARRNPDKSDYHQMIEDCRNADLLLLDDIGGSAQNPTMAEWELIDLGEIIDARARSRGKWTIITSQQTVDRISSLDNRIASRIHRRTTSATRWEPNNHSPTNEQP